MSEGRGSVSPPGLVPMCDGGGGGFEGYHSLPSNSSFWLHTQSTKLFGQAVGPLPFLLSPLPFLLNPLGARWNHLAGGIHPAQPGVVVIFIASLPQLQA